MRGFLLGLVLIVGAFAAFTRYYGGSQVNAMLAVSRSTASPTNPKARDQGLPTSLDFEARRFSLMADSVVRANDKGTLYVSPGVAAHQMGLEAPSETVTFLGGSGHDVIELHQDGIYARLGDGSDHIVITAGEVAAGQVKKIRGDEGWDTAVLGQGMHLRDVAKRTSPYTVIDPLTGGRYELDVEQLGVIDNLTPAETAGFPNDLNPALNFTGTLPNVPFLATSSLHYSSSKTSIDSSNIYEYDARLNSTSAMLEPPKMVKVASLDTVSVAPGEAEPRPLTAEELAVIPLNAAGLNPLRTKSPFGGYPSIFSIEGGYFAVSSAAPVKESFTRDNVASATLSISTTSLADSAVRIRLLTERELTLRGDLADPTAVSATFEALKEAGIISGYTYNQDRHIRITYPTGESIVVKPTLFLSRISWIFPEPYVMDLEQPDGRIAFAIVGRDGFAQTFVEVNEAIEGRQLISPIATGITRGILNDLRSVSNLMQNVKHPEELVPVPAARIVRYEKRGPDQYALRVEADGGVFYVMSETPINPTSYDARVMNATISISSLFYARRDAHVFLSNGDRIFTRASLMNPSGVLERFDRATGLAGIEGYRLTKELIGPLSVGFHDSRYGKIMPVLFGSRTGLRPGQTVTFPVVDGRSNRFSFVTVDPEGFAQANVDIGGSTILPALPKP